MTRDRLTVLTTTGPDRHKLATKRITRDADGEWQIHPYDHATWWSVGQIPVHDFFSLAKALQGLEADRRDEHDCWLSGQPRRHPERSCVIRGEPLPGINWARTRRLKDPAPMDGTPPSFAPAARQSLGIALDSIPTPLWNVDKLARRRAAIERNRAEHGLPLPKGEDDPAPIDPVRDWEISIRAAVITLPAEFHDASVYWQMTSSAGIKAGIRMRLWYWLDRPVSDDEAKRWLKDAPVDTSLYTAVGIHYTAAPIFEPPALDVVPLRSGFWLRFTNTVSVPDLTEKPKPKPAQQKRRTTAPSGDGAQRYAAACINSVVAAPAGTGEGRRRLIAVARTLYGMANHKLLEEAWVTAELQAAMDNRGWAGTGKTFSADEVDRHLAWAKAHADTTLPEGFR